MFKHIALTTVAGLAVGAGVLGAYYLGTVAGSPANASPVAAQTAPLSEIDYAFITCQYGGERFYAARGVAPEETTRNANRDCDNAREFYGSDQAFIDFFIYSTIQIGD